MSEQAVTVHEVRYRRGDGVWYAELVADERCHTWGRTLREGRAHARDAVALWRDVGEEAVEVIDVWDSDDLRAY